MTTLSSAQYQILATSINSTPAWLAMANAAQYQQLADALNAPSSPAVTIWIPNVDTSRLLTAIVVGDMSALTAAQLAYLQMMLGVVSVDATLTSVRTNFSAIFSGKPTLANMTAVSQRTATAFEGLFTAASVCSLFGYTVSPQEVRDSLGK